jgi:general secretion pathway protein A
MYLRHYGLRELPFELTPNPRFLFMTSQHREALANLQYGLTSAKAVTLLLGEAGTGKTTLLRSALETATQAGVRAVHLTNPGLSRDEFVETLARAFGFGSAAQASKATFLAELETALRERRSRDEITAVVIDEAQRLSEELLEEVRLLANIETDTEKLLPLVLAGQPELADRLNRHELRQLKQRVALRCEIRPFALADTAAYIASRIRTAGGSAAQLFTREAVMRIHEYSGGIPRTISVICDNALLSGFAAGRQPVGSDIIKEVARDFDLIPAEAPVDATTDATQVAPPAETPSNAAETAKPVALSFADIEHGGDAPPAEKGRRKSFLSFGR